MINLENERLKKYSLVIEDCDRITSILGELAIKNGNYKRISKNDWYTAYPSKLYSVGTIFKVNEKGYMSPTKIDGLEEKIIVNYYAESTGKREYFGRDENEYLYSEYHETYLEYETPIFYKVLGELYYSYLMKEKEKYSAIIELYKFMSDPSNSDMFEKIDDGEIKDSHSKILEIVSKLDKKDELEECEKLFDNVALYKKYLKDNKNRLEIISKNIELSKIYEEELSKLIYLVEYDNQYMRDLNSYYEYILHNESLVINKDKFLKEYGVEKYNFEGITKKVLKKEYNH